MTDLAEISFQDSLLYNKNFDSRPVFDEYLKQHLPDKNSRIFLVQFPSRLNSLENVSACLFMLSWIPAFMRGLQYRAQNPLSLLFVYSQGDWFLAALTKLAVFQQIHQFILLRSKGQLPKQQMLVKEKVKKVRTVYQRKIVNNARILGKNQFVQRIGRPVPQKEEYWSEIEVPKLVEVSKIGNVPVAEVDKVIKQIKRLEVISPDGQIKAANFYNDL